MFRLEIKKLSKNDFDSIHQVAEIFYGWWGKDCNLEIRDLETIVKNRCGELLPVTYVAKIYDEVVGTVAFLDNDAQLRPDLYPMIGGMYVKEQWRNKGIASKLLTTLISDISKSFKSAYLTTPLLNFYEKFGFKFIEITNVNIVNGKYTRERLYKIEF